MKMRNSEVISQAETDYLFSFKDKLEHSTAVNTPFEALERSLSVEPIHTKRKVWVMREDAEVESELNELFQDVLGGHVPDFMSAGDDSHVF